MVQRAATATKAAPPKARQASKPVPAVDFSVPEIGGGGRITLRQDQMYAVVESVTADRAQRILDEATQGTPDLKQRRPSAAVIDDFGGEHGIIRRGEWLPVPPGIVYDRDRRLLNGNQRLLAQVRTGQTLPWWITYNCDPAVFALIDTHKKRTIGEALYMAGAVDVASLGKHLGSGLRLLATYEAAARAGDLSGWVGWAKARLSNQQILSVLPGHPNIGESLTLAYRVHSACGYNIATVCAWHRMVCDMHPASAEQAGVFADQLAYQRMIDRGFPAYALARWAGKGYVADKTINHRIAREVALHGLLLAWNAYASNRTLTAITVSSKNPMPVPLPWLPPRKNEGSGRS